MTINALLHWEELKKKMEMHKNISLEKFCNAMLMVFKFLLNELFYGVLFRPRQKSGMEWEIYLQSRISWIKQSTQAHPQNYG